MAYLDDMSYKIPVVPAGVDTQVWLSQNENGRQLYFEIIDGVDGQEIPEGSVVTISGTKPDGVVYSAEGTLDGNVAVFDEDTQMTAVAGAWIAKIRVTNEGNTIATGRIKFIIDADPVREGSVPSDSELEGLVAEAQQYAQDARSAAYGSPLTAATAADMTLRDRVYVYTGSETGYTAGNWYYWNGSAWTSGGAYNSTAVQTDTGLTIPGMAADAKATGEAITAAEESAVAEALASAAPEYSNAATYAVGDYVVYNGQLFRCNTAIETAEEWTPAKWTAAQLAPDVADLKADLNDKVDKNGVGQVLPININGVTVVGGNIMTNAERIYCTQLNTQVQNGYVSVVNGRAIVSGANDFYAWLVPIKPNTNYTSNVSLRFMVTLKNLNTEGTTPVTYGDLVTTTALQNVTSFDSGEAEYAFISYNHTTAPSTVIISPGNSATETQSIYLPEWLKTKGFQGNRFAYVSANSMNNGDYIHLPSVKNNLRKGECIVISGDITAFTKVRLNFKYNDSNTTNFIEVSDTYITIKNSSTSYTAHGLTISENFFLEYEYLDDNTAQITLTSDGNSYTHVYTFVRQSVGYPQFVAITATLTNVKMSWTCKDLSKNIWLFGDSYVGYATTRWPYYLKEQGYDKNILLDGFPGEGSVNARVSFNNLLNFGIPHFAVWCMGMNDGSDSETAPSESWISGRDLFLSYCSSNAVTPVFATIPTVPTISHEEKNAWIRSSGYRYIDFAKAVGATSEGVWFTGMLSSDNVHPTEQGAKALYARVLLDFPEIMIDNLSY